MITIQTTTLVVLLVVAGLGGALIAVLPMWRSLGAAGRLPVWGFVARRHAAVEGAAHLEAEIRCALCSSQPRCRDRLAAGADTPPPGCPNSKLFG